MKIKRITIQGFKSFVDRTSFSFPQGTSSIVGPNGCGKSNIVDAIRWVLGEQNARHLRGKVMEDLIFGGSDSRKPVGMAEVTLTFQNDNGNSPVRYANFSEIEVLRRLYRSGESEYYINKVQSRLRDIIDLFTDTGIGTKAYSIIEQGQVGWLITAKPEERRTIFEEAAGINKYKLKKDSALRKLDATRENLTRVNDIISEVKRQLNSLNRQAKKAERYKTVKDELKGIELYLSSTEFRTMTDKGAVLKKDLAALEDTAVELTSAIGSRDLSLEELNASHLDGECAYNEARQRAYDMDGLIGAEERTIELASLRVEEIARDETRLGAEIEELDARRLAIEHETAKVADSIDEISEKITASQDRLDEKEGRLKELVEETTLKTELLKGCEAAALDLSVKLADTKHAIHGSIREEELLRVKQASHGAEAAAHREALVSRRGEQAAIRETLRAALTAKAGLEAEAEAVREKLDKLERENTGMVETVKALNEELAAKTSRLEALEEMKEKHEGLNQGIRSVVDRGEAAGVHGILADFIETSPGFEKAVETALGERLQYVVVDGVAEGMEAVEYLKTNASGRASFIPLNGARLEAASPRERIGENGTTELAGEVNARADYAAIVKHMLSDVDVVEDLDAAARLWKSNGIRRTLVTRDGDMIDPSGIITGGRSEAGADGLLQKRSEIKSLRQEVEALKGRAETEGGDIKRLDDEIASTRDLLKECIDKVHLGDIERVNIESRLAVVEEECARLASVAEANETEGRAAEEGTAAVEALKQTLTTEREELEAKLEAREGERLALGAALGTLVEAKEELSSEVTDLKVELASTHERATALQESLDERRQLKDEMTTRALEKAAAIERGRGEKESRRGEVELHRVKLDELLAEKDALKNEVVAKEEALNATTEKIRAVGGELKELKREHDGVQEQRGAAALELKELELNTANLKEKIIERYGTDITTYTPDETDPYPKMAIEEVREKVAALREKIGAMGEVSLSALEEYMELEGRYKFLIDQKGDLESSVESLHNAIVRINKTTRERFRKTFEQINETFKKTFPKFFQGGKGELRLTGDGDMLEAGIEIIVQPPGKRLQNITLLSGGERALAATALIFSIFLIKPSPFCLLDEVDAPLDDANIDRFNGFVKELSKKSQFILITHNKRTMEMADSLIGITMQEPGVSKAVSVNL